MRQINIVTKTTAPSAKPVHSMLPYFLLRSQYSTAPATAPPKMASAHSTPANYAFRPRSEREQKAKAVTVGGAS